MFISEALAQTAGSTPASSIESLMSFAPLVLIFVVFYFLMIRPQQKKAKAHQAMVRAAKRGDRIVTSGGILGVITKANDADNDVEVEISHGVKVRVVRSAISDVVNRAAEAAKPAVTKEGANDA
jgi:preprotein translocase subunit YajC